MTLILILSAVATAFAAVAAGAAWGFVLGLRGRVRTLTLELERAHGERHEAFLAAIRMADTAGAQAAAEYVLHARAASVEELADAHMDELEAQREEEETLEDPLFQHLEDLADHDGGILYDPLEVEAGAV